MFLPKLTGRGGGEGGEGRGEGGKGGGGEGKRGHSKEVYKGGIPGIFL